MTTITSTIQPQKSSRVEWADALRGICMICVLISHQETETSLSLFFRPFYMPAFFFVSGFLYKFQGACNYLKILKSLLVPYIILSYASACLTLTLYRSIIDGELFSYLQKVTVDILLGKNLWFISCLIIVQLFYTTFNILYSEKNILKI